MTFQARLPPLPTTTKTSTTAAAAMTITMTMAMAMQNERRHTKAEPQSRDAGTVGRDDETPDLRHRRRLWRCGILIRCVSPWLPT